MHPQLAGHDVMSASLLVTIYKERIFTNETLLAGFYTVVQYGKYCGHAYLWGLGFLVSM